MAERVVVDANLMAALIVPLPYSEQATIKFTQWRQSGMDVYAPSLMGYEVASMLRKAVALRAMAAGDVSDALRELTRLDVQQVAATIELHRQAILWAERTGQPAAYDGHYLALAEQMGAAFWTADRRLKNAAQKAGALWVHWVGEGNCPSVIASRPERSEPFDCDDYVASAQGERSRRAAKQSR